MVTKKQSPAGRNAVKDDEVKTAYHDEVLNWLIDNLAEIVGHRWGMDDVTTRTTLAEARKEGAKWVAETVSPKLRGLSDGTIQPGSGWRPEKLELSDAVRSALAEAAAREGEVLRGIASFKEPETTGQGTVEKYEVMKPVSRYERRELVDDKRIDAGFIDLACTIFVPRALSFTLDGVSVEERYKTALDSAYRAQGFSEAAKSFAVSNLRLQTEGVKLELWFSVRTGPFTLGEILQELKTIKGLESRNQHVALVVDGIDPNMKKHIEREGMVVIDRDDYRESAI